MYTEEKKVLQLINKGKFVKAKQLLQKALKKQPQVAQIHHLLGMVYIKTDRIVEAITYLKKASQLKPQSDVFHNLALVLAMQGEFEQAKEAHQKAIQLEPGKMDYKLGYAQTLKANKDFSQAILMYKTVAVNGYMQDSDYFELASCLQTEHRLVEALEILNKKINQPNLSTLSLKLQILVTLGRRIEAIRLAKTLIQIAVKENSLTVLKLLDKALKQLGEFELRNEISTALISQLTGWQAIVEKIHHNQASQEDIETLKEYFYTKVEKQETELKIPYALAAYYKSVSNKQWIYWTHKANENALLNTVYDHHRELTQFEKIKQSYQEVSLPESGTNSSPIFIVGMPRSGTTLFESMLSAHSKIFGCGELGTITQILNQHYTPDTKGTDTWLSYLDKLNTYTEDDLKAFAKDYMQQARQYDKEHAYLVDKFPHNFLHLGMIAAIFPNAKIVRMRRNPIAVCLSIYEQHFRRAHDYKLKLDELAEYYQAFESLMDFWQEYMPGRVYELDYDLLVENPEQQLKAFFEHNELPYEDACLAFHKKERTVKTASVKQVRQGVYTSSKKRWTGIESDIQPLLDAFPEYA